MIRRLAFGLALAAQLLPGLQPAEAGFGWRLWVQPVTSATVERTTLRPNATWRSAANTSDPVGSQAQVPQPDRVRYGAQDILAVSADGSLGGVPQLTVPSTALMSEGDEFRVDGTGLAGVDGFSRLHIVDATHVDLCDTVNYGTGPGVCAINAALRPRVTTAGYAGTGGKIWFDQTAVAAFDEHPNVWCEAEGCTITVGAASNTGAGIDTVRFCLDTATNCAAPLAQQTINTSRAYGQFAGDFGWVVRVASPGLFDAGGPRDGIATLYAIVTPVNGFQRVIALPVILNGNGGIQHPQYFVDATDPLASDTACDGTVRKGDLRETAAKCPFKTLLCAAGKTYSATSGPEIRVAGTAAAGTMGTKYLEASTSTVSGCTIKTSDYPVRFVAEGPVYITAATASDSNGTGRTVSFPLNLPAGRIIFEGPFAFDNAFTQFKQSVSGGMAWIGRGAMMVNAGGSANTFLGARGLEYGWTGTQEGASVLEADATTFFGIGEATMDTVTGIGFSMYRNVAAQLAVDFIQHGAIAGQKQPLSVWNYHATLSNANVNRRHVSKTLTIASLACITSYDGKTGRPPALDITFTTTPWDAALQQDPIGYSPLYLTMISGGASNGLTTGFTSAGDANVYAADELNNPSIDGNKLDLRLKVNPSFCDSNGNVSGGFKGQVGDIGFLWFESHADWLQLNQETENTYLQDLHGDGMNIQPLLLQVGNSSVIGGAASRVANATLTTAGRSFTFSQLVPLLPGDFISLPLGSDAAGTRTYPTSLNETPPVPAAAPLMSRRVETVVAETADVTATYQNGVNLLITDVGTGQTVKPGMEIYTSGGDLGKFIVSQIRSDEGGKLGGKGLYVMSSERNQGTPNVALRLVGVGSGTLVAPFPTDQTTPIYANRGGQTKDLACVNCSLVADTNLTGLYAQWQAIQRHVFFSNMTTTALKTTANGNNTYVTLFRNNTDGFAAEASGYNDTIGPAFTAGSTATLGPGMASLRNVQVTDNNNGNNLITLGASYVAGTTFDLLSHLAANPTTLLTVGARNARAVPFDARLRPRAAGAPVGAFVR